MLKKIYKYPLKVQDTQTIELPYNSEILTVQVQHEIPILYALVDTSHDITKPTTIETIGTGNIIENGMANNYKYIGSYQLMKGDFVGHVFVKN